MKILFTTPILTLSKSSNCITDPWWICAAVEDQYSEKTTLKNQLRVVCVCEFQSNSGSGGNPNSL